MKKVNLKDLRTIFGGYRCANCGKTVKDNALSKAWHWLWNGCWGY